MRTSENARGAVGRAGEAASGPEKETRRSELLDGKGLLELVVRIAAACGRQGGRLVGCSAGMGWDGLG